MDTPLSRTWINYAPGRWVFIVTPGSQDVPDDAGNIGYYGERNDTYYNIQSVVVDGDLLPEFTTFVSWEATSEGWFYDTTTTKLYIVLENYDPPRSFINVAPGAAVGFSYLVDDEAYYQNVFYEPRLFDVPNISKAKDPNFYGILQYQTPSFTFNNEDGYFDTFNQLDLYNQPYRIFFTFDGEPYSEALQVYQGRIKEFASDQLTFTMIGRDPRENFSRQLPINTFSNSDSSLPFYFSTLVDDLDDIPVPIIFGPVIQAPAYQTNTTSFTFADTTYNSIDSGITVYDENNNVITHGGTETDGTFTLTITSWDSGTAYSIGDYVVNNSVYYEAIQAGTNHEPPDSEYWKVFNTDKITVTCTQTTTINGLDVISDNLDNYEGIAYSSSTYDTVEWTAERGSVLNMGLWIGDGNLMTSADIIEQVCNDNQGIFDVLSDGRYTFRTFNADRVPSHIILADEILDDGSLLHPTDEILSSIKIAFSENLLTGIDRKFHNTDYEAQVYAIMQSYRSQPEPYKSRLTSKTDAETLSVKIMDQSSSIPDIVTLTTKTQNISMRVLDNIIYTYERVNGNDIVERSRYQVLSINIDLSNFELFVTVKKISADSEDYHILDGGDSTTDFDFYDGGSSTTTPTVTIDGV
jgi:hypothetical protein